MIVGKVGRAQWKDVEEAIQVSLQAQPQWDQTAPEDRANCLLRAAHIIAERRMELAAWEVIETGKTWREADADVAEAIDFLDYYARAMRHLKSHSVLKQVPGRKK